MSFARQFSSELTGSNFEKQEGVGTEGVKRRSVKELKGMHMSRGVSLLAFLLSALVAVGLSFKIPGVSLRPGGEVEVLKKLKPSGLSSFIAYTPFASPHQHAASAEVVKGVPEAESVQRTIEMNATPEECFRVATGFDHHHPKLSKNIKGVKVLEKDRNGVGKRVEFNVQLFGRGVTYVLSYQYQQPRKLSWIAVKGMRELIGSYEFVPLDSGRTKVVYNLKLDPGFKIPGLIANVATGMIAYAALVEFKRYIERPETKSALNSVNSDDSNVGGSRIQSRIISSHGLFGVRPLRV